MEEVSESGSPPSSTSVSEPEALTRLADEYLRRYPGEETSQKSCVHNLRGGDRPPCPSPPPLTRPPLPARERSASGGLRWGGGGCGVLRLIGRQLGSSCRLSSPQLLSRVRHGACLVQFEPWLQRGGCPWFALRLLPGQLRHLGRYAQQPEVDGLLHRLARRALAAVGVHVSKKYLEPEGPEGDHVRWP